MAAVSFLEGGLLCDRYRDGSSLYRGALYNFAKWSARILEGQQGV